MTDSNFHRQVVSPHPEYHPNFQTDEELEGVIKELLLNSRRLDARDITVTVDKGNVTLSGSVKSQDERDYACEVARLVQGVGDISSQIVVKLNDGILPTDIGRKSN
jgi:hypothetical protein